MSRLSVMLQDYLKLSHGDHRFKLGPYHDDRCRNGDVSRQFQAWIDYPIDCPLANGINGRHSPKNIKSIP